MSIYIRENRNTDATVRLNNQNVARIKPDGTLYDWSTQLTREQREEVAQWVRDHPDKWPAQQGTEKK
jgi:hypothetical protein